MNRKAFWWLVLPTTIFAVLATLGALAHPLWSDEAQTAVFARNILEYGVPKGWDGVNLVGVYDFGTALNRDLINHVNGWVQFYLAAASFRLFGISSFSARLPFLLLGVLTLPLSAALAWRLTGNSRVAALTAMLLTASPQFILYSFQARHYPVSVFLDVALLHSLLGLFDGRRWSRAAFVAAATLLLYNNFITFALFFIPALIGVSCFFALCGFGKKRIAGFLVRVAMLTALSAIVFAPWFLMLRPLDRQAGTVLPQHPLWAAYSEGLRFLFPFHGSNVFPIGMIPLVVMTLWRVRKNRAVIVPAMLLVSLIASYTIFVILVALGTSVGNTAVNLIDNRYHVVLIPLLTILIAIILERVWRWSRVAALAIVMVWLSNLLALTPPRVMLWEYLQDIHHPYPTPDEAVAEYLLAHASDGQTAFVSLERDHEPLLFHLGKKLRFINRLDPVNPLLSGKNRGVLPRYLYVFLKEPDWVIFFGKKGNDGSWITSGFRGTFPRGLHPSVDLATDYEETVLPVFFSDMSRPELPYHQFQKVVPDDDEQVFIYRKKPL